VERPVAVDVPADTAGRGGRLTVLAPETVIGLGVGEAVWVYNGEDVEVVLVLESCGCGVLGREKLVGCVFNNLCDLLDVYCMN
jgi:hypothetical protein